MNPIRQQITIISIPSTNRQLRTAGQITSSSCFGGSYTAMLFGESENGTKQINKTNMKSSGLNQLGDNAE